MTPNEKLDHVAPEAPAMNSNSRGARAPENPRETDRALLVELDFGEGEMHSRLAELNALAISAGAEVASVVTARRARPDAALFAGRGKVEELAALRASTAANLVIFDHVLSGA